MCRVSEVLYYRNRYTQWRWEARAAARGRGGDGGGPVVPSQRGAAGAVPVAMAEVRQRWRVQWRVVRFCACVLSTTLRFFRI